MTHPSWTPAQSSRGGLPCRRSGQRPRGRVGRRGVGGVGGGGAGAGGEGGDGAGENAFLTLSLASSQTQAYSRRALKPILLFVQPLEEGSGGR